MNTIAKCQRSTSFQCSRWRAAQPCSTARPQSCRRDVASQASGMPIKDRVLSSLPYLIPMCDGLKYGKFLMIQYPIFATFLAPLSPFARLYFSVPFFPLIVFFAVYIGIVNNQSLDRSVRYNAMQAILLDIILIVPSLLESTLRPSFGSGPMLQIYITGYNTLFLFVLSCVVYGVVCLILLKQLHGLSVVIANGAVTVVTMSCPKSQDALFAATKQPGVPGATALPLHLKMNETS